MNLVTNTVIFCQKIHVDSDRIVIATCAKFKAREPDQSEQSINFLTLSLHFCCPGQSFFPIIPPKKWMNKIINCLMRNDKIDLRRNNAMILLELINKSNNISIKKSSNKSLHPHYYRGISMFYWNSTYLEPSRIGSSKIGCFGSCGDREPWFGELLISACCK